ncbi:MAG: hemagglutinin repeat-containing protein [Rickettsiaceae bacterium]|nr:hemagglutinin repeat-containing protein [Rickettsiaceae bacterium]MDD9337005.1 hemagglutinin repeat-containing protein [Rickettsiaceae bacterium]
MPTNAVTGGLYAYLEASHLEQTSSTSVAIDNTISGEVIMAHVTNDIRFQGVQMTAKDVDFTAANFTFETSRDQCDYQYDFSSVNIEIDLNNAINSNLAASTRSVESSSTIHHANYIKASGNLKITLSGDGKFKGVSLEGTNVDIQANNLILESVQDIISERLSGANLHVGFDQKYGITGFGGGVEDGFKDKAWTNQVARIIGSQLVNIIVKETLEIAGGLIANAEEDKNGKLTDKGNLSVNCGRILVKTIHDYDEGVTLGIGASFQVNQTDQGKKDVSFSHAPVKVEFKDHRREVAGTIGQGKITSGEIKGDQLNRDISQQAQVTKEQQASFDSVVHADMLKTLLGSKEESKRPPNIKTLTRTVCGQTLPEMIRDYFFDIADTAKQAAKDVITSGAKAASIFGAKVNPDQLADNLDKGFDWHLGLKLSSEEVRKFNEKYADTKKKLEEKAADGDEEEKHHLIFQQNLQQQVTQADSDGSSNKAALQVLLHIYQVLYHKEQNAAEKEGRPVKSFEEFAAYVNKNYIYKSPVFAAKVHNNLVSALLETQLMLDARLQSSVEKVDGRNHADQHSNYPEDKTAHHPKFISGGENSIKSSKVDGQPVSGAGQTKEDEAKAITTVDDKPFDYSMLFLAKPESKELKLSPDTAALLKAILPFQQVPSSSTTAGGSDWQPKTFTDIFRNIYDDCIDLRNIGSAHFLNPQSIYYSLMGETYEYLGENVIFAISKIPGGKYALEAIGFVVGSVINTAHSAITKGAKIILDQEKLMD